MNTSVKDENNNFLILHCAKKSCNLEYFFTKDLVTKLSTYVIWVNDKSLFNS